MRVIADFERRALVEWWRWRRITVDSVAIRKESESERANINNHSKAFCEVSRELWG